MSEQQIFMLLQDSKHENDQLRSALEEIGRAALACWSEMQGRLVDDEHRRAHRALASIAKTASDALS